MSLVVSVAAPGFAALAHVPSPTYGAPRIHLKGTARLEAHVRASSGVVVLGTLLDDANAAVADARVRLRIARADPGGDARVALSAASPEICDPTAPATRSRRATMATLEAADAIAIATDDRGAFCVRLVLSADRYAAHLESAPTARVDAASSDVAFDVARPSPIVRFDPEPGAVDLEGPPIAIAVSASIADGDTAQPAGGIALRLANETGAHLADATTDPSGHVRWSVPASALGPPGPGELRVFVGDDATVGTTTAPILRRTHVDLVAVDTRTSVLPAATPDDGILVRVRAVAEGTAPPYTMSPTGVVEARVGDRVVGAAAIAGGAARLTIAFGWPRTDPVPITMTYLPDAPWFIPSGALALVQPVRPPGHAGQVLTWMTGAALIAWLVLARLPGQIRTPWARAAAARRGRGAPSSAYDPSAPEGGWAGRVVDAHDGSVVADARVAVVRPGFDAAETVVETVSDEQGRFVLAGAGGRPGDRLVVEARLHASAHEPLPTSGRIEVALVLRRRALLDRLVRWARRRGGPFDARPEPTPRQVREAAAAEPEVARWAEAVERSAFGREPVDEAVEQAVDALTPAR